jgi:hypothetical protein
MILVSVYIHDDRYSVPTWRAVEIMAEEASAYARLLLTANEHYARVELVLDNTLIAKAERSEVGLLQRAS